VSIADEPTVQQPVAGDAAAGPIALDGMAYGIDSLDALLVFHLGDAQLHAAWVRADAGFRAADVVGGLRDAYRVAQFASRRLAASTGGERRGEAQNPRITLEVGSRLAMLRRVRSHVVAVVFDAAMPLGMARLVANRLSDQLEPELPRDDTDAADAAATLVPKPRGAAGGATIIGIPAVQDVKAASGGEEREPATVAFGRRPSQSRPTLTELDRTRRLLAYVEAHAPEPHVVRLRIALRTGLTPLALDHPEALAAEAVVLIETAVEDILGVDRVELRSLV
jgi:hypothetical protein